VAEIRRVPEVIRQELLAGNTLTGAAPAGAGMVDSGETLLRGQYRTWTQCTAAGLVRIPPAAAHRGVRLARVMWNLPGVGTVTINLLDENGVAYQLRSVASATGAHAELDDGVLVPPGWAIQVVATNVLTGNGNVVVILGQGMNQDAFSGANLLGEEAYPPSMAP